MAGFRRDTLIEVCRYLRLGAIILVLQVGYITFVYFKLRFYISISWGMFTEKFTLMFNWKCTKKTLGETLVISNTLVTLRQVAVVHPF